MQLTIIAQFAIALLAGELSGTLPIDEGAALAIVGALPLAAWFLGRFDSWLAGRAMDQAVPRALERHFARRTTLRWLAVCALAVAACGGLSSALEPAIGSIGVAVLIMTSAVAAHLAAIESWYPIERRLREATLLRELDLGGPLAPMPSRAAFVVAQARAQLGPVLVPLVVPAALAEAGAAIARAHWPDHVVEAQLAGGLAGAVLLVLLVPVLVPRLLGLRRLGAGSLRDELAELAGGAGVSVREIWVWPTDGLVANAAVIGFLPGFRCVMLSDCLLESMPRRQVLAVMAHELGHVVRRHVAWMIAVLAACYVAAGSVAVPLAQAAFETAVEGGLLDDAGLLRLMHGLAVARDVGALVLALWLFGYFSRRFERQADTFAVQLLSARAGRDDATPEAVDAMVGALGAVAFLNHVPRSRRSWRHGSIAWRQAYLTSLVGRTHAQLPIDRFVRAACWISLALACVGAWTAFAPAP